MNRFQHSEISEKVIGAAMRVHRAFGLGFPEIIYKRALMIELENAGLAFRSEVEMDIFYEGIFIGKRRLDLLIEDVMLIELKAVSELDKKYYNQIINYLNVFKLEVGLLLNFGTESLQFKRLVNTKDYPRNPIKS